MFSVLQNRRLNQHIMYTIVDEVRAALDSVVLLLISRNNRSSLPFSLKSQVPVHDTTMPIQDDFDDSTQDDT